MGLATQGVANAAEQTVCSAMLLAGWLVTLFEEKNQS